MVVVVVVVVIIIIDDGIVLLLLTTTTTAGTYYYSHPPSQSNPYPSPLFKTHTTTITKTNTSPYCSYPCPHLMIGRAIAGV